MANTWVTYLDRSYKSIKASLINRMKTLVPEITDFSESNIYVIIISSFAGLVEQLNYYIDNVARESFHSTARRYSSMVKLTRIIDYRIKAKISSTVDLKITAIDGSGDPVPLTTNDYTFDAGIIVKDDDGVEFITEEKATMFLGTSSVVIPARQGEETADENIGTTTAAADQVFQLNDDYRHDSLQITINALTWELQNTLAFSGPIDRHFIVEINEAKEAWVKFGDGVNGDIPPTGNTVYATYHTSKGLGGNVEADTLIIFDVATEPDPAGWAEVDSFEVTNPLSAGGGLDEEGIEGIRAKAPLSLRTLDRAVTLQDHQDIALLVPGVGKAAVEYDAAVKKVSIYIAPSEGGTASSQLKTDVETYFETRRILSTGIEALSSGETVLRMTITATAKFRRNTTQTEIDIKEALEEEYGFNNSSVNRKIRKSDIIALVDNLDKVDYLDLEILTTKPFPRIITGVNSLENNWSPVVLPAANKKSVWRISITSSTTALVHRTDEGSGEVYDGEVTYAVTEGASVLYTSADGAIQFKIWGTFTNGDRWGFTTYAYNEEIEFDDFTVPIYDESELTLTVNSQPIAE